MGTKPNSLKRAVALIAAACTLGTCCIAGSIAWAGDSDTTTVQGANTGNIDASKKDNGTSIIIHKYQGPASETDRSDGTVKASANEGDVLYGKKPVKGVEFQVCKVTLVSGADENAKKIDLSTAEGWKKIEDIQKLDPASKKADSFLTGDNHKFETVAANCKKQTTGDDGSATFKGLAESLYYVEESDTNGAQIKDGGEWKSVTVTGKVDPFFITTPLPHKTATSWEWLYDVNVYPKNDTSNDLPTKTPKTPTKLYVADDGSTIIPWDISMPLTPPSDNKAYKKIGFVDSLPEGLTYDSLDEANVKLVKTGKAKGSTSSDVTLTKNTDYTVTSTEKDDSTPAKVKFELSQSRLGEINKDFSKNTYVLKVTLNTKVAKGTKNVTNAINGWVDNSNIGDDGTPDNPCVPTPDKPCDKNPHGTSHFATLKITKVAVNANADKDKKLTDQTLKGAIFAVYVMKDQSKELTTVTKDNLATTTDPVKKGTNNDPFTIETGADGTASVDLFIANDDKTPSRKYCLVETKAPAGFKLNENPICYEVKSETKDQATAGLNNDNAHKIGNDQATELDKILAALPMTGARGLVILTVCGIVGIAGTFFYIVMKRRKEQEAE